MKLKVYGCRGSAVFSRHSHYGGNTSCITLESNNSMMILDAGSGLMQLDAELREKYPAYPHGLPFKPNILISHLHLDHILGLTSFAPIWAEGADVRIFTCTRSDRPLNEQIFGVFAPPYWPVSMANRSRAQCVAVAGAFDLDGFTVTPFAANHGDNTLSFHITNGHKTVVHLLDNEISPEHNKAELLAFCRGADLVIFDAAYLPKDYPQKRGWGHSTVLEGIKLADESGCVRMVFAHYAQEYADNDLDSLKALVPDDGRFIFAHEGMTLEI